METTYNTTGVSTDNTTGDTFYYHDPPLDNNEEEISVKREGDEIVIRIKRKNQLQMIDYNNDLSQSVLTI